MPEQNHEEITQLTDLSRRFQYSLRKVTESARFRRSPDRAQLMADQIRRTHSYLELALEALEGRLEDDTDDDPQTTPSEGGAWVRSRVDGLAHYLAEGASSSKGSLEALPDQIKVSEDGQSPPWPWEIQPTVVASSDAPAKIKIEAGHTPEEDSAGFSGDCSSLGIPDLLAMLQAQVKTGVLRIVHPNEAVNLHFDRGELVHAYSEHSPDGQLLGEILVSQGSLTQKRLNSVLFCHFSSPRKIGEILREGQVVSEEQLEKALAWQVQELFHRLYSYNDSSFYFRAGLPSAPENRARRNVIQLLLESARVHDEESQQVG